MDDATTDDRLLERAADGDDSAFGVLFERHFDRVHAFLARRTGDREAAEDLASVVFLEAWRQRGAAMAAPDGSLLPWLYGIAHNLLRNRWRTQLRHRRALRRLELQRAEHDFSDEAASRLDAVNASPVALAAVRALPRHERDVAELCLLGDVSYADAAVALRLPVGTVRSRLSRARARLRDEVHRGEAR